MRPVKALRMKFAATRIAKSAITPPAEYQSVSLLAFIFLSCALVADDDPGGEKREADERCKENDVAKIEHAALEAFEVRHHRKCGDHLHHDHAREPREK